jgi:hypothetical protein
MASDKQQPDQATWDRVGWFLEDIGIVAQSILRRNLNLWNGVSQNLRQQPYTADALADDAARAIAAGLGNIDDVWSLWTRTPQRERVATGLPTAFLFFPRRALDASTHSPPDPVVIRVPFEDVDDLPQQAEIALGGQPEDGAQLLRDRLTARLQSDRTYLLESFNVKGLKAGVYDGAVYITDPPRALTNLRAVVQGPVPGR